LSHAVDLHIASEELFLIELSLKFNTPDLQAIVSLNQREHLDRMNNRPDRTQADQNRVTRAMQSIFQ
jgi:hypothetical protein